MHLTRPASGSSGWLPAAILALVMSLVLVAFDTSVGQVAIFGLYVVFGLALPGMLWVRLLRRRATHISEDLTLGLAVGYCLEIATYIPARAVGAPLTPAAWWPPASPRRPIRRSPTSGSTVARSNAGWTPAGA